MVGEYDNAIDQLEILVSVPTWHSVNVAKLDPTGECLWQKIAGDWEHSQVALSIAADPAGLSLVTGYFSGTIDFGCGAITSVGGNDVFVAKLSR